MADDTENARTHGRSFGAQRDGSAQNCPYAQTDIRLRLAWFDGFSEGRADLERQGRPAAAGPAPD